MEFEKVNEYRDSSTDDSDLEIENELYSVIHHNDFSQGIPEDLHQKYNFVYNSDNELEVSLKTVLDTQEIITNKETLETKQEITNKILDEVINISDTDDEIIIVKNKKNKDKKVKNKIKNKINNAKNKEILELSSDDEGLLVNFNIENNHYEEPLKVKVTDIIDSKTQWKDVISPQNWTEEMKKFYNEPCEKLKNFDHHKILKELKKDKSARWYQQEYFLPKTQNQKCRNCRQIGHTYRECFKRFPTCIMCGNEGHKDYACPMKMCLNCGAKTGVFVDMCGRCSAFSRSECFNCHRIGHEARTCPDNWRRFHSTISGPIVTESNENPRKYCCNCGSPGHLDSDCQLYFKNMFPKISLFVQNYSGGRLHSNPSSSEKQPNKLKDGYAKLPKKKKFKKKKNRRKSDNDEYKSDDDIEYYVYDHPDSEDPLPEYIPKALRKPGDTTNYGGARRIPKPKYPIPVPFKLRNKKKKRKNKVKNKQKLNKTI